MYVLVVSNGISWLPIKHTALGEHLALLLAPRDGKRGKRREVAELFKFLDEREKVIQLSPQIQAECE